jgi:Pathogenicity locus
VAQAREHASVSKASCAAEARRLTDIPNIGKAAAADLVGLGITTPADVKRMDPFKAYDALRDPMGQRHDPCVLDTFMAAHDFMNGGPARPWWDFTEQRKNMLKESS